MPDSIFSRLKVAWNVFRNPEFRNVSVNIGPGSSMRPDRYRFLYGNDRSMVAPIYNQIGIDVSAIPIRHVRLDGNERFLEVIPSGLNNCLSLEANLDQTGRAFIQDVVMSMCDEGVVAIVPIDTTIDPMIAGSYDILSMRTGRIIQWYPDNVRVEVYNQLTGMKQEIVLNKKIVSIIENPFFAIMNEPNSTLKRLIAKLNLLDAIDQQSGSGKLDLIVQLPYVIKSAAREQQALQRKTAIETQLKDSKYGIAYIDGTEKVTQLNRPAENNLMEQIEYLTSMLYSQLGLTKEIFDGTADEKVLLNYYNRTIEPFLSAIVDGMRRVFLTKTGRSQGQSIMYIRDPFRLVPVNNLAEIADKFTRNEIISSNEMRAVIGLKPSSDPKAEELRNKNLNESAETKVSKTEVLSIENQNGRSKSDYAEK